MTKQVNLVHDYQSTLLSPIPISTTGEIQVSLADEIDSNMGFIVIDRDDNTKEERMFFHKKNANTLFVYSVNRDSPRQHNTGAIVVLDILESMNYTLDNTFSQMYIYKVSNSNAIITGGEFFIDGKGVTISDMDTSSGNFFVNGVENNVYIKDGNYFITNQVHDDLYHVGIIFVGVTGNIERIKMVHQLPIGNGLTNSERSKLQILDHNLYEKLSNKTTEVRSPTLADNNMYPTEKAVAIELHKKVDKVPGKVLSDKNFTKQEKDYIALLMGMNLDNIDFSKLHGIRDNIRNISIASHSDGVTEYAIANKLKEYVLKEYNKGLSTNDFDDKYKTGLDKLLNDNTAYLTKGDTINPIRHYSFASNDKVPTEKAVAKELMGYIKKDASKVLTDVNFSQSDKDKLDLLSNVQPTSIIAGTGIRIKKVGDTGYKISSELESSKSNVGNSIDIFPTTKNAREKYIDEQRYIVLEDKYRAGFYGQSSFTDASNPSVKVFYNNPGVAGKIMIDTHIRVMDKDGKMNERHDSIPYEVSIDKGHSAFELQPSSFQGLDYNNSQVMYIEVFRVGAYYTDKHGNENNVVLDDRDTVQGSIRFKGMYINYDQVVDNDFTDQVEDALGKLGGYNGDLIDSNCNKIATVKDGLVTSVESNYQDSYTNSNGVKGVISDYILKNITENRTVDNSQPFSETQLSNWLGTLIKDLQDIKLIQFDSSSLSFFLNRFEVKDYTDTSVINADTDTLHVVTDFLGTFVEAMKSVVAGKDCSCNCTDLDPLINVEIPWYTVAITESRQIDIDSATVEDYINILGTLVKDLQDVHCFDTNDIVEGTKVYTVLNGNIKTKLDNSVNDIKTFGYVLYSLITDLKKINIIK